MYMFICRGAVRHRDIGAVVPCCNNYIVVVPGVCCQDVVRGRGSNTYDLNEYGTDCNNADHCMLRIVQKLGA